MGRPRKMVLIVSDNMVQQSVTSFLLRTWGYRCATATGWEQAAKLLAQHDYSVLLSFAPERPQLLNQFRQAFPRTATVFVGFKPNDSVADAYVMPDSDKNALREAIRARSLRRRGPLASAEA